MEAILPVFIAVLLAEMGGRVQMVGHGLALRFEDATPLLFGLTLTSLINLGIGAVGGAVIAAMIAFDARTLLFGLALVFAGVPMLIRAKAAKVPHTLSALPASLIGFGRAQIGDASQFIVFAVAARSGEPVLALLGGILGVLAACTPAILLRKDWPGAVPLVLIRYGAALLLTVAGAGAVISALKLI